MQPMHSLQQELARRMKVAGIDVVPWDRHNRRCQMLRDRLMCDAFDAGGR